MDYLWGFRKQHTDILVDKLPLEVLPNLRLKVSFIQRGLELRKLSSAERKRVELSNEVSSDSDNELYNDVWLLLAVTIITLK